MQDVDETDESNGQMHLDANKRSNDRLCNALRSNSFTPSAFEGGWVYSIRSMSEVLNERAIYLCGMLR